MTQKARLEGKVAIVTGAAQGIGEGIAEIFVEHGAHVIVADIQRDKGQQTAERLGNASFLELDVRDANAWTSAVEQLVRDHGRIDILVNNAGGGIGGHIENTAVEAHQKVMGLNLDATWIGIRAVVPAMAANGGGSIVNISSIDGLVGVAHLSSYVASKFAVTGLTRSLAIELGEKNIRVNSVHPGIIDTPLLRSGGTATSPRMANAIARQPIPRLGTPREIGYAALFFASDESSFCTGSALVADGGHIAGPYRDPF